MALVPFHRFVQAITVQIEPVLERTGYFFFPGRDRSRTVRLLAYAGYRNADEVRIRGRVVRYRKALDAGEGFWTRFRAMMEIYNSHEVPGITIRLEGYGHVLETRTDHDGYFTFSFPPDRALPSETSWEHVTLSTPEAAMQQPSASVPVLAPGTGIGWGIISDIDDTVIETGATNFIKNWRRVLVDRPSDRLAVPGASTLYKMIAGDHVAPVRPFFYVSSSPWNLYGFLTEFMELNSIPHGPMFLTDYGIDRDKFIKPSHTRHKLAAIQAILDFYPDLKFLLIGDNGQDDVEIYARAAGAYPDRVGAVFIRDVNGNCRAGATGERLAEIEAEGIPVFCGSGFDDALATVKTLNFKRPIEAAKAVAQASKTA